MHDIFKPGISSMVTQQVSHNVTGRNTLVKVKVKFFKRPIIMGYKLIINDNITSLGHSTCDYPTR